VSIGACLLAIGWPGLDAVAAPAIDRLEQIVAAIYRPGDVSGAPADQVRTASTLLIAYGVSGRLPYSMLAEELMQNVQRTGGAELASPRGFDAACARARVLCGLAALHEDPNYRAAAVIAPGVDHRAAARDLLAAQASEALRRGAAAAIYGIALLELESPPI